MENREPVLHLYFYAKKEPRKKDGKFPIMGRLVYGEKRVQFATQVFLTEEMLPHISEGRWMRSRRTKEMSTLAKIKNLMWMQYAEMGKAGVDIDLACMVSELKKAQKEPPAWWEAMD